nr:FAD-binding oxidoreductase [Corynebacterium lactis]
MANKLTIPYRMRWWGWGVDGNDKPITPSSEKLLQQEIGMSLEANNPPRDISEVSIPEGRLNDDDVAALSGIVGEENVATDHDTRVKHAVGRSYADLARLRAAKLDVAPDAVVLPKNEQQIVDLFKVCSERKIAIVAFGGGTSVVGGVEAVDGGLGKAIAVSMVAFDKILEINEVAGTATVETGVFGPDLEEALAAKGFTAGHFPQSFEYSTVGGWVSCRSAGQESSGYGRIDRNVIGMRVVTPAGTMEFRDMPSSASGPNPRELFLGSEGTLGIITHVTIALNKRPKKMLFDTYFFDGFDEAASVLRKLEQDGHIPHLARLSDEKETHFGLTQLAKGSLSENLAKYLDMRGIEHPCMVLFGFAQTDAVGARVARERLATRLLGKKCVRVGAIPGMTWVNHRFSSPYLRDVMMTRRVGVDTLETATTWDQASELRRKIIERMEAAGEAHGTPVYVFCHISHMYESGCSLYFTYFFRETEGEILQQWMDIKSAASNAMMEFGGTITHHHGVGQDHSPQYYVENTELFTKVMRAVKAELDPAASSTRPSSPPARARWRSVTTAR